MANNYYPFGLSFNSYQRVTSKQNDYLYNGKELQDELDLNWLDYGARMYNPALSRWFNLDPLADRYKPMSPYNYGLNNPIRFVDPDGRRVRPGSQEDLDKIKMTLTEEEAKYVKINKKGFIKEGKLNRGLKKLGESDNFKALGTLVNSEITYNIKYASEFTAKVDGELSTTEFGEASIGEDGKIKGFGGVTFIS